MRQEWGGGDQDQYAIGPDEWHALAFARHHGAAPVFPKLETGQRHTRIFARGQVARIKLLGLTAGTFPALLKLWEKDGLTETERDQFITLLQKVGWSRSASATGP